MQSASPREGSPAAALPSSLRPRPTWGQGGGCGDGAAAPRAGLRRGEACPSGSSVGRWPAACAHLQGWGRTSSAFILSQVGRTAPPLTLWQNLSGCFLKGIPCLCLPDSVRCKNDGVSLSASKTYRNMWKRSIFQIENHVQ